MEDGGLRIEDGDVKANLVPSYPRTIDFSYIFKVSRTKVGEMADKKGLFSVIRRTTHFLLDEEPWKRMAF